MGRKHAPCLPTISATCSELGTGTHSVMLTLFLRGSWLLSYSGFSSLSRSSKESWSRAICKALWSSSASPWTLPSANSELGIALWGWGVRGGERTQRDDGAILAGKGERGGEEGRGTGAGKWGGWGTLQRNEGRGVQKTHPPSGSGGARASLAEPSRAVLCCYWDKQSASIPVLSETRPDCPPPLRCCFCLLRICAAHRDTPLTSPCGGAGSSAACLGRDWLSEGGRGAGPAKGPPTPLLCCPPSLCLLRVDTVTYLSTVQSSAPDLPAAVGQHRSSRTKARSS